MEDTPIHAIKSKQDVEEIIELLEVKCRVMNISDEYGKQIEKHINDLKTLIKGEPLQNTYPEPSIDTQGVREIFNNFKI